MDLSKHGPLDENTPRWGVARDELNALLGVIRDEHQRGHDEPSMRWCGPVCRAAWALGAR